MLAVCQQSLAACSFTNPHCALAAFAWLFTGSDIGMVFLWAFAGMYFGVTALVGIIHPSVHMACME